MVAEVGKPRQGLPRSFRLRRSPDFARVNREGGRIHLRDLVVIHRANGRSAFRFGLAVSKKVGGAVVRNRVKRWLREAIRRERSCFENTAVPPRLTGRDVVFIARPSAAGAGLIVLRAEVADAFSRIRGVRS